jgi:predicted metal-binding membrane protein
MTGTETKLTENKSQLWRERETLLVGLLLLLVAALAWLEVVRHAHSMQAMSDMSPSMAMNDQPESGMLANALAYIAAWGVMMAAMMLPSAIPMIALYGAISRNFSKSGQNGIPTMLFGLVYLVGWLAFGIPIYIANVVVDHLVGSNPTAAALAPYGVALVLFIAGVYQFTPLKRLCLRVCQSPFGFLMTHWRAGYIGTFKMAFDHAIFCMGCCWALMIVLVAAGAMALHWVLLIAVVVFAEKILPRGEWIARITGVALVLLGVLIAIQPQLAAILQG